MSSVYLTPEHESFRAAVRRFLEAEVAPHAATWERLGTIPRALFRRLGELGYLGIAVAPEHGGAGRDLFFAVVFLEELPRSLMGGFCAAISVQQVAAIRHILRWGSDDLKRRYLAPSLAGRLVGALGVTEPDAGSDIGALRTVARRAGDAFVVNGAKTFVTNGGTGDFVTLAAKTDAAAGAGGISLLVVDLAAPGVRVARRLEKLGWHSSDTAELAFEDVRVPAANLIGQEGMGFHYLMDAVQLERLACAAIAVGSCAVCLERTLAYMKQRSAFGHPLTSFQALTHRLADLAAELEGARALVYHAAWLLERGEGAVRECAMAKLLATELAQRTADDCLQCFGGYGFMEEHALARFVRDARAGTIVAGTSETMRELVARSMIAGEEAAPVAGRGVQPATATAAPEAAVAAVAPAQAAPEGSGERVPASVEELMATLPARLRPDKAAGWRSCCHFKLRGAEAPEWTVRVEDGACRVERGLGGRPDCVIEMTAETYVGIETGRVSPQVAFMTGKVRVSDIAELMRFVKAFRPVGEHREEP